MADLNRQILLAQIPQGKLTADAFRQIESAKPTPQDGEVLLRTLYVALDAANRAWMMGPTYRAALNAGDVMAGAGLAQVVESRHAQFAPGDLVYAETGWQDFCVLPARQMTKIARSEPLTQLLNVYGTAGLTAYFGLLDIGQPKAGETVVVSAAAGAVGLVVGQIAKLKGCRVVGIAGGPAKCELLTRDFGFDAAVDYKAGELFPQLMTASQGGADIYFDNVGGEVFEACLFNMKQGGRIVCCGGVSAYDGAPMQSVRGVPGWFISRRLTMRGFIVSDFFRDGRRAEALAQLRGWVESGQIKVRDDVINGLENLPAALIGLLAGDNIGKRMVKVA